MEGKVRLHAIQGDWMHDWLDVGNRWIMEGCFFVVWRPVTFGALQEFVLDQSLFILYDMIWMTVYARLVNLQMTLKQVRL